MSSSAVWETSRFHTDETSATQDLDTSPTPHYSDMIQHRIGATDRQIDNLVYELYGLTEEEVAVVEGSV